jgi:hypothetical protein
LILKSSFSRRRITDFLNHNRLVRSAKNARNELVDRSFRARGRSEADRAIDDLEQAHLRNLCFTVAFNVPWTIEVLVTAWRKFPTGLSLVVANNSSDAGKRREIESICNRHCVPHIHLPYNPEWHPCRSHGIAMNWLYVNVVGRLRPDIFGFIDHDCFPIRPYDVIGRMHGRNVFGVKRESQAAKVPGAWNLWAGFCFYRFSSIETCRVDFKRRIEFGLDTGGGNWLGIYNALDPGMVAWADERSLDQSVESHKGIYSIIDDAFLHVGRASVRAASREEAADRIWNTYLGGIGARAVSAGPANRPEPA